jgi:hypothetical protein
MYNAKINSPSTKLESAINDSQTTITLLDSSVLPTAPNLLTIGDDEQAETCLYTNIVGNTVTIQRGFEGVAKAWEINAPVARLFTAYDHNTFKSNIDALPKTKSDIGLGNVDNVQQAPITRTITAGNGLSGGGNLTADRIVSLGTPSTLTGTTTNSVSTTSHTHAISVTKSDVGLSNVDNVAQAPLTHVGSTGNSHGVVTTSVNGFMSSADKTKLDSVATGAQVNVSTNIAQGTRTTTTVPITSSTGTGATLDVATTSLAGVMSSADKTKLDGIQSGAQVNSVTSVSGKTGAVTLTNSDVGLGNVDNKSSETIRSEITSSNVTTALGYTPVNKAGDTITGNLTIGTGTVSGTPRQLNITNSGGNAVGIRLERTAGTQHEWEIVSQDANLLFSHSPNSGTFTSALSFSSDRVGTFDQIPILPSSNPTTSNQATRKAYVDTQVGTREPSFTKNTAFNKNYGTTATDVKMNGTQAVGSVDEVARIDHVHPTDTTRTPTSRNLTAGNGLSGGGDLSADRTFTLGTPSTLTSATTNAVTSTSHTHAITMSDDLHGTRGGGTQHSVVTTSVNGFMSSTDKTKLDGVATNANNYTHPSDGGGSRTALSGATVINGITVNTAGHVTATTTRNMTTSDIGAEPSFTKNTAFNKNFGTTTGTVCQGNDSRLHDPSLSGHSWANQNVLTTSNVTFNNITSNGNVGIGTSAPSEKLHVAGKAQADNGFKTGNFEMVFDSSTNSLNFNFVA